MSTLQRVGSPRRIAVALARRGRLLVSWFRARRAFRTVYGQRLSWTRLQDLTERNGSIDAPGRLGIHRRVTAGFDHHHLPTPFAIRFGTDDVEEVDLDGVRLVLDRADTSVSGSIIDGHYEPHLLAFVRDHLTPGMTFVDVGANVGLYTMLAARLVGPSGRVFAVEPNSENCRLLLVAVERNGFTNVTLHPVACGPERGRAVIRTALGSNGGIVDGEGDALLDPTATVVALAPLDDLVDGPVDLIKIDVEGAEALVIGGAGRLLAEHRPTVISEFSPEMLDRVSGIDALAYLQAWVDRGYAIHVCDRDSHALVPVPDPAAFMATYPGPLHIEDLVLRPR